MEAIWVVYWLSASNSYSFSLNAQLIRIARWACCLSNQAVLLCVLQSTWVSCSGLVLSLKKREAWQWRLKYLLVTFSLVFFLEKFFKLHSKICSLHGIHIYRGNKTTFMLKNNLATHDDPYLNDFGGFHNGRF